MKINNNYLSIVIPTFNRCDHLDILLKSIEISSLKFVEIIIVDDGSTDDTKKLVEQFLTKGYKIKYFFKKNGGRHSALKLAIKEVSYLFTIIVDSDDYFLPFGTELILRIIKENLSENSFLFPVRNSQTKDIEGLNIKARNFIEESIDFKLRKYDKKEVVRTSFLKECNFFWSLEERRVPTMLLWLEVSSKTECKMINIPIMHKKYLPDGLSKNILNHKVGSPFSMYLLYEKLYETDLYKNKIFRLKSGIQKTRFYLHCLKRDNFKQLKYKYSYINFNFPKNIVLFTLGMFIFLSDIYRK